MPVGKKKTSASFRVDLPGIYRVKLMVLDTRKNKKGTWAERLGMATARWAA